jgi:hypothetical protein
LKRTATLLWAGSLLLLTRRTLSLVLIGLSLLGRCRLALRLLAAWSLRMRRCGHQQH